MSRRKQGSSRKKSCHKFITCANMYGISSSSITDIYNTFVIGNSSPVPTTVYRMLRVFSWGSVCVTVLSIKTGFYMYHGSNSFETCFYHRTGQAEDEYPEVKFLLTLRRNYFRKQRLGTHNTFDPGRLHT